MVALYVTYKQNGQLKRGVISENQYKLYLKDVAIVDLQIHGSQRLMEDYYYQTQGINKPSKQLLLG